MNIHGTLSLACEETLTIEKLVYGGEGLARLEGKVVLTPFVLPGEVVRAETERAKNDLWRGRLIEVLQPSPSRIAPGCPYFQRCGGCQYQHIDYAVPVGTEARDPARSVAARRQDRIRGRDRSDFGRTVAVSQSRAASYRRRARSDTSAKHSRDLFAIDHCPIASPKLNETIGKIEAPQASTALELFTNETEVQVNVVDRVPRPASDYAGVARGDDADRIQRIPESAAILSFR